MLDKTDTLWFLHSRYTKLHSTIWTAQSTSICRLPTCTAVNKASSYHLLGSPTSLRVHDSPVQYQAKLIVLQLLLRNDLCLTAELLRVLVVEVDSTQVCYRTGHLLPVLELNSVKDKNN